MGQQDLKSQLLEQGFVVVKNIIPTSLVDAVNRRTPDLYPTRGHAVDNKYYPKNRIAECSEFALWWSQQLHDWPEVQAVGQLLINQVGFLFEDPTLYVMDVITNTPKNKYIKPHIDSPYRFDQWHESFELLGVQCIVPLCEFTEANGGTGLLPGSHKRNWIVQDSYRGVYNDEFLSGVVQPHMMPGDALIYFPRVLHSTMPNTTENLRRALLIHITGQKMVEQMKLVDNIWLE